MTFAKIIHNKATRLGYKVARGVVKIAVPISLFALLLSQVDLFQTWKILQSIEWGWAARGFLLFAFLDVWRALRYSYLLKVAPTLLFPITVIHGSLNTILPFRLGELSFPYLLSKCGLPLEQSLVSLVGVRLLDLGTLCGAILVLWFAGFGEVSDQLFSVTIILIGSLVGIGGIGYLMMHYLGIGDKLGKAINSFYLSCVSPKWRLKIRSCPHSLREMASSRSLTISTLISMLVWWQNCLAPMFLLRSVGISLGFGQAAFAASVLQLVSLLPVNFMGGLGFLDISWVGFLMLYAIPFGKASEAVVATRLLFYAFVLIWSLFGGLWWMVAKAAKGF